MPFSLRFLALPCLLGCLVPLSARAAADDEAVRLGLILQQLRHVEVLAGEAQAGAPGASRYGFDYPRFARDLERVRTGIEGYLAPSRAQPRDPGELEGRYRQARGEVAP